MNISKTELAKELGIAASTVSGYVSRGLPVSVDGTVDLEVARQWVKANVKVQSGSRGAGARGARRQVGKVPADEGLDPVREQTRYVKLRADRVEMENARLKGGTEDERQLALAEGAALRCWWTFQKAYPAAAASVLAHVVDRHGDRELLHLLTELTRERDQLIMRGIYAELCRAFAGLIEPDRDFAPGVPWRPIVPTRRRRVEEDVHLVDGQPFPPRQPEADDD